MQAIYWGKLSELIPIKGMKVMASAQRTVGLQHSQSQQGPQLGPERNSSCDDPSEIS